MKINLLYEWVKLKHTTFLLIRFYHVENIKCITIFNSLTDIEQIVKFDVMMGRASSRKFGQLPISAKIGNLSWKKGTKNFTIPYSISFLSALHQNKTLHNFHKRGQGLTVGRIKGLGQDGASNTVGSKDWSGSVYKRNWIHLAYCYGQALQLADGDTIKAIKRIRGSLDAVFEMTKVIKCSMFLKL